MVAVFDSGAVICHEQTEIGDDHQTHIHTDFTEVGGHFRKMQY